jgi:glutamyl-tRNA reductase
LNSIQIIAFTHKKFEFDEIGLFHINDVDRSAKLNEIKQQFNFDEIVYLSTCNRVEFIISNNQVLDNSFLEKFLKIINKGFSVNQTNDFVSRLEIFTAQSAVQHLFSVASSLDSLVVGEREIITQVRKAYEDCKEYGVCGDILRVFIQKTVQTAKKIYTESNIAKKPVSVVSLSYLELQKHLLHSSKNILVVGAGKTITSMLKFVSKGFTHDYTIYNRSLVNAKKLSDNLKLGAKIKLLSELGNEKENFDLIITCTGVQDAVITKEIYSKMIGHDTQNKIIVDLAVPNDFSVEISEEFSVELITVNDLKIIAEKNIKFREKEINICLEIIKEQIIDYNLAEKERQLERALSEVPKSIKDIKQKAYDEVFVKELEKMDDNSREVLDKFIQYMEKKYISVPIVLAKDILLK